MSWDTEWAPALKRYLDDSNSTDYTTERLNKFLAMAMFEISPQISLTSTYTIDITTPSISPDPAENASLGALVILKAASIVMRAEMKKLAITAGYAIKDDKTSIDGKAALQAYKDTLADYEKNYERALQSYRLGNGNIGRAIISPYTS